jgi:hypothetical protein
LAENVEKSFPLQARKLQGWSNALASPWIDRAIALVLGIVSLAAYIRTLAPDILFSDSGEFQCLAYTLGITHSTGYPIYLLLGRLIGFLPIGTPAWRINLLSAVCGAITVGGVYLLAHKFTASRLGAALGSIALAISYTFWSQAIISEVYTPGMAFLVIIMLLMFAWQADMQRRSLTLGIAALLAGIGFGVHASVWLVGPVAAAFVIWNLKRQKSPRPVWVRSIAAGAAGAVIGLAIFVATFLITDHLNTPTSFINTTLEPSRVFWNLPEADFQSPLQRLKMTVDSAQWGPALFPGGNFSFLKETVDYFNRLVNLEFSPLIFLFALAGFIIMIRTRPATGWFFPLAYVFSLFFILNYRVGDKYVFYLSTYIPLTVAAGVAMGFSLEKIRSYLQSTSGRGGWALTLLPILFFLTVVIQPAGAIRWHALKTGVASFVTEDYVFPVKNLKQPRVIAQTRLMGIKEDNAVFLLDWRAMYSTAYLAYVEKGYRNTLFFEAMPAGNNGKVASTLIEKIKGYLAEGRPVYAEQKYPGLEENFRLLPALGDLYKVSLRK